MRHMEIVKYEPQYAEAFLRLNLHCRRSIAHRTIILSHALVPAPLFPKWYHRN